MVDKGDFYEIHVDLPGVSKEDIEISVTDDIFHIQGHRKQVHEDNSEFSSRLERSFGKVERWLKLPRGADGTKANAKFENGVLLVTFPKIEGEATNVKKLTIE